MNFLHVSISAVFLLIVPLAWPSSSAKTDVSWDYMVLTQRWPISFCYLWEEESPSHWCQMPNNIDDWSIHGIWPNKNGEKGPNFCNSSWHFDVTAIKAFVDDLEQHWPNLEGGTSTKSLWQHEWQKHGTCAAQLPAMNSISKYFKQGLLLNVKFNLTSILANGGVSPRYCSNYTALAISTAVKKAIGTNINMNCVKDKQGVHFLQEIQICLSKSFQPINCNSTGILGKSGEALFGVGTCPKGKVINYPKALPDSTETCFSRHKG